MKKLTKDDKKLNKLKQKEYGLWRVVGDEFVKHTQPSGKIKLKVLCLHTITGEEKLIMVGDLLSGNTTGYKDARMADYINGVYIPHWRKIAKIYQGITQRCNNPNDKKYKDYGGRGIKVLFENIDDFILYIHNNFLPEAFLNLQIDRIDNEGHYEPGNIRFVTSRENSCNKRTSKFVEYKGQQVIYAHLWHLLKRDYIDFAFSLIHTERLLRKGFSPEEILYQHRNRNKNRQHSKYRNQPDPEILALYDE